MKKNLIIYKDEPVYNELKRHSDRDVRGQIVAQAIREDRLDPVFTAQVDFNYWKLFQRIIPEIVVTKTDDIIVAVYNNSGSSVIMNIRMLDEDEQKMKVLH